jgi:hypothetical protein
MTTLLDEIRDGNGLTFAAGAREFHVHPATFGRWAFRGCRATDGTRIKLEHTRWGGRLMTSRPAVERYFAALNAATDTTPIPRSPAASRRDSEVANVELEGAGW